MADQQAFDPQAFLAKIGAGRTLVAYQQQHPIFAQGEAADAVFYIQEGQVKLTVVSAQGKEAVIALLAAEAFFGEGCLAGQPLRMATATALTDCALMRIEKPAILQVLHAEPTFSALFMAYLLSRNSRIEADLIDQLFNSSEKRLARGLFCWPTLAKKAKPSR
jgi:CRP-like cAMP-binding protein